LDQNQNKILASELELELKMLRQILFRTTELQA